MHSTPFSGASRGFCKQYVLERCFAVTNNSEKLRQSAWVPGCSSFLRGTRERGVGCGRGVSPSPSGGQSDQMRTAVGEAAQRRQGGTGTGVPPRPWPCAWGLAGLSRVEQGPVSPRTSHLGTEHRFRQAGGPGHFPHSTLPQARSACCLP